MLDEENLALVLSSDHRHNCLIHLMTQSMGLLHLTGSEKSLMDANITQFNESISVCERIIRTPIPLSYTRLTFSAVAFDSSCCFVGRLRLDGNLCHILQRVYAVLYRGGKITSSLFPPYHDCRLQERLETLLV
ncbi:hypothetical protein R1flu_005734 [Riccia fluitans]|uniref:Uncharacterized protein n=1 Tax=Riccia fluitans TaxID=41844 RepID=A0ABD1YUU3_9MARC